jgi:hypothetical protein
MITIFKGIKIEWERDGIIDTHQHEIHYAAVGTSEDGREWIGTWIEMDGEFESVEEIEENNYA